MKSLSFASSALVLLLGVTAVYGILDTTGCHFYGFGTGSGIAFNSRLELCQAAVKFAGVDVGSGTADEDEEEDENQKDFCYYFNRYHKKINPRENRCPTCQWKYSLQNKAFHCPDLPSHQLQVLLAHARKCPPKGKKHMIQCTEQEARRNAESELWSVSSFLDELFTYSDYEEGIDHEDGERTFFEMPITDESGRLLTWDNMCHYVLKGHTNDMVIKVDGHRLVMKLHDDGRVSLKLPFKTEPLSMGPIMEAIQSTLSGLSRRKFLSKCDIALASTINQYVTKMANKAKVSALAKRLCFSLQGVLCSKEPEQECNQVAYDADAFRQAFYVTIPDIEECE